jgi:hypothetical protein
MTTSPAHRTDRRARRADRSATRPADRRVPGRLVAVALAGVLALAGCDLRLETPPPVTPTPDAVEQVRDATARDAVALADAAEEAAAGAPVEVAGVLLQVAEASRAHADALGGVYVQFPEHPEGPDAATDDAAADDAATDDAEPDGEAAGAEDAAPGPPADPASVLEELSLAASAARSAADSVADGDFARLLASVAVGRLLLAEALARATGAEAVAPDLAVPATAPAGLAPEDLAVVVRSEDAAGLVWEVAAARSADEAREAAARRAVVHRDRAQAWAVAAGVAGTADDPRRSTYDLPDDLVAAGATQEAVLAVGERVEADLAVVYASLVARADPGARGELVDAVAEYARRAVAAGAAAPTFPGLPERA